MLEEELVTLLAAVAAGDENAFAQLSEHYAPLVKSMSARFAPSFESLGDAAAMGVQDLELYEVLMTAVDNAPGDPDSIMALYNYLTDNAMYVGLYNSMKHIVATTAVTECVTCYAQYINPAACTYVWNE